MKRLLITGGSGYVGGYLVTQAPATYDTYATYHTQPVHTSHAHWCHLDLTDRDQMNEMLAAITPDIIIHSAAMAGVDSCEQQQAHAYAVNVAGTEHLASYAADHGCRFLFLSTDMVFDGKTGMYSEQDAASPINFYGTTKYIAEDRVRQIGGNYVIVRTALVYGASLTKARSFNEMVVERLQKGEQIRLFDDQYRSLIWVVTLARALIELCEHNFTGLIHLGGPQRISRFDFGREVAGVYQLNMNLVLANSMLDIRWQAPRPQDVSLCVDRAQALLKTRFLTCQQGLMAELHKPIQKFKFI